MINEKMRRLGENRSTIRELFEFGRQMKLEAGADAVFDFSLGNPSVSPPRSLKSNLLSLIENTDECSLHGYTSAEGDIETRSSIAKYIKESYGIDADASMIYMTTGAAGALVSVLGALTNPGENVIVIAPFFPEYRVFVERGGAKLVSVLAKEPDFTPDVDAIEKAINDSTAAIIINSPNNPTGAVYSSDDIKRLSEMLDLKSREVGHPIYLIADEPYRELVYDGECVPFIPNYYKNTIVCYSYSKSLSIPGERIGYVFVSPEVQNRETVFRAIAGAGRALGYVCAPSLLQKLVPSLIGECAEIEVYKENRDILYSALTDIGYEVVNPKGAFYLFMKSPLSDAKEFSEIAKKYGLLLVPSDDFGCEGYLRIAYCKSTEMIKRSLGAFSKLFQEYSSVRVKK